MEFFSSNRTCFSRRIRESPDMRRLCSGIKPQKCISEFLVGRKNLVSPHCCDSDYSTISKLFHKRLHCNFYRDIALSPGGKRTRKSTQVNISLSWSQAICMYYDVLHCQSVWRLPSPLGQGFSPYLHFCHCLVNFPTLSAMFLLESLPKNASS